MAMGSSATRSSFFGVGSALGVSSDVDGAFEFVAAYDAVLPFAAPEADLFFDLVRARLATTVTLLYWRLAARDEADPYRQKALAEESGAALFLQRLDALGRNKFREKLFSIQ